MRSAAARKPRCLKQLHPSYRPFVLSNPIRTPRSQSFSTVERIPSLLNEVNIDDFRQRAFLPEVPILISPGSSSQCDSISSIIPAVARWFEARPSPSSGDSPLAGHCLVPNQDYLSQFAGTVLPYETTIHSGTQDIQAFESTWPQSQTGKCPYFNAFIYEVTHNTDEGYANHGRGPLQKEVKSQFCRFNAPLSLFLEAFKPRSADIPQIQRLYIAQAQIQELPKQLRDDVPIPELVKHAGKGDIYDTSIWMGLQPTYTPLHKDPNPNLFVQIASRKVIRLYKPTIGASIFREVQAHIGAYSSAAFRGQEMMQGSEKEVLEQVVWGDSPALGGFEVAVNPGDALFIPKGWWHSIKSHESESREVNASVNWWFR